MNQSIRTVQVVESRRPTARGETLNAVQYTTPNPKAVLCFHHGFGEVRARRRYVDSSTHRLVDSVPRKSVAPSLAIVAPSLAIVARSPARGALRRGV